MNPIFTGGGTGISSQPAFIPGLEHPGLSRHDHHSEPTSVSAKTHLYHHQCVKHTNTDLRPASLWVCVQARVNDELVGYRDLAALPRDKAILQVERPDLMTYQPHLSFSPLDPPRREVHSHTFIHAAKTDFLVNSSLSAQDL